MAHLNGNQVLNGSEHSPQPLKVGVNKGRLFTPKMVLIPELS